MIHDGDCLELRDPIAVAENQRDDLLAYLSAARSILDVGAGRHGVRSSAQELALALVRELGVEACAIALRDRTDAPLALAGFAAQSDRFGAPWSAMTDGAWLTLAGLVGTVGEPSCYRRDADGGFTLVGPGDLVSEGFTAVAFRVEDERDGVLILHTIVAPGQAFGRIQGFALLADMVGGALTTARLREAMGRLCDKLSMELGVTRRRLAAREQTLRARDDSLARMTRELVRSNNVKAEFLATVSHELRTPLNAILGYTDMLLEGHMGPLSDQQVDTLSDILRAARNLHLRVDDVLFFVQLDADRVDVRPEPVAVARVVDEVASAITDRPARAQVEFRVVVDPGTATIATDAALLRRVLFHLLGNAFKFTEQGTISLTIEPGARVEDVMISVRDSGVGIPPDRQRAIFDAFVQVDGSDSRRYEGLGMGLALVDRSARLLGGRVGVESSLGSGSEFTVLLPGARLVDADGAGTSSTGNGTQAVA